MANSLRTLKMPLFLEFLRGAFKICYNYNDDVSEEELLGYIRLNRNKLQHVWIEEKWLKELREVIDKENMIRKI